MHPILPKHQARVLNVDTTAAGLYITLVDSDGLRKHFCYLHK
jgi:hypothetical protein